MQAKQTPLFGSTSSVPVYEYQQQQEKWPQESSNSASYLLIEKVPDKYVEPVSHGYSSISKDLPNMIFLAFLCMKKIGSNYFADILQGIGLALSTSTIPYLYQAKLVASMTNISMFAMITAPYLLKILWAPIVDTCYVGAIGRRKSWLVPICLALGGMLFFLSYCVQDSDKGRLLVFGKQQLPVFYMVAFLLLFVTCLATLDIVIDGWTLELLKRDNLVYSSTIQTIGMFIGYSLGYQLFINLHNYFFSIQSIFLLYSALYVCASVGVAMLKQESVDYRSSQLSVSDTYRHMYQIISLPHMKSLVMILLLSGFGFAVQEHLTPLKLAEKHAETEIPKLFSWRLWLYMVPALLGVSLAIVTYYYMYVRKKLDTQVQVFKPFTYWKMAYQARLAIALIMVVISYFAPKQELAAGWYSTGLFLLIALTTVVGKIISVLQDGFFATVADVRVGGTYMTMLKTFATFGDKCPSLLVSYLVDMVTMKMCMSCRSMLYCISNVTRIDMSYSSRYKRVQCAYNSECTIALNATYFIGISCVIAGFFMFRQVFKPRLDRLTHLNVQFWCIQHNEPVPDFDEKSKAL